MYLPNQLPIHPTIHLPNYPSIPPSLFASHLTHVTCILQDHAIVWDGKRVVVYEVSTNATLVRAAGERTNLYVV